MRRFIVSERQLREIVIMASEAALSAGFAPPIDSPIDDASLDNLRDEGYCIEVDPDPTLD